jgi:mycoredoxin-dependent peroxiredoxin
MSTANAAVRTAPIAKGEVAPDISLQNQDRAEWKLSDAVKQGDLVLSFFPFAFTGVCGTEMKCVTREMADWKKKGATVVGISCDSPFVLKAWAEKEGFEHTLLSDQHRAACKAYGIHWPEMNTTQRATVVIAKGADGKGKVKWVQTRQPGNGMKWEEVLAMIS